MDQEDRIDQEYLYYLDYQDWIEYQRIDREHDARREEILQIKVGRKILTKRRLTTKMHRLRKYDDIALLIGDDQVVLCIKQYFDPPYLKYNFGELVIDVTLAEDNLALNWTPGGYANLVIGTWAEGYNHLDIPHGNENTYNSDHFAECKDKAYCLSRLREIYNDLLQTCDLLEQ